MRRLAVMGLLSLLTILASHAPASADVSNDSATNAQDGDNEAERDQSGEASSGDAVAGQVVGVTSSGDASVDASNTTRDSSAESGDVHGANAAAAVVGQFAGGADDAADVASGAATNAQDGDNSDETVQSAAVVSGDAVAGQVAGVTTAPGGTADVVLANTTIGADVETGEGEFFNGAISAVGLFGGGGGAGGLLLNVSDASAPETGTLSFIVSVTRFGRASFAGARPAGAGADARAAAAEGEGGGITFTYSTHDGSATHEGFSGSSSVDYVPNSGTGSIPPGSSSTTVSVETTDDDLQDCEGNESMSLTIDGSSVPIGDGTGIGTITENSC